MIPLRRASLIAAIALLPVLVPGAAPAAATSSKAGARASVVPWIADDYAKALAEARARRVPLFIEAWAPW